MSQLLCSFLLCWAAFFIMHSPRCKRRVKLNGVKASSEESQEMSKTRTISLPLTLLWEECALCRHTHSHTASMCAHALVWWRLGQRSCYTGSRRGGKGGPGTLELGEYWEVVFPPLQPTPLVLSQAELKKAQR